MRFLILSLLLAGGLFLLASGGGTYVVQPGDTLAGIAARHNTTAATLVELNRDRYPELAANPGLIRPGWELRLPAALRLPGVGEIAPGWQHLNATLLATPTPMPHPGVTAGSSSGMYIFAPRERRDLGEEAFARINRERQARGLTPFLWDEELYAMAVARARDMIARRYYGHFDPATGRALYPAPCGEVLSGGDNPAESWKGSAPHWRALMSDSYSAAIAVFRAEGIGRNIAVGLIRMRKEDICKLP